MAATKKCKLKSYLVLVINMFGISYQHIHAMNQPSFISFLNNIAAAAVILSLISGAVVLSCQFIAVTRIVEKSVSNTIQISYLMGQMSGSKQTIMDDA